MVREQARILIALEALNTRLFFIETPRNRVSTQQPREDLPPAFEHWEVPLSRK